MGPFPTILAIESISELGKTPIEKEDGTIAQTNIGNCADVVAGAGSTTTGQSGFEISGTMANSAASCKIIALYKSPSNAFGTNAVMEVLINEHLLKDSAGI